ncbi:hypothetical protein IB254_01750 [Pseudomonas sp. PDM03]|uniref:hypothetical protein n=1 Tax=Pseudomonas sp. PDM03 TaxID=2769266 RepID=UPI0017829B3D|nr:hypothetical protein [Pseudomonas sp. PDM03]MBD9585768.1 hypothetical protein [Pseudomonas sp. PDM03]
MSDIKERPILFSAPMVRAILEGRKTVTRRAVNPQPVLTEGSGFSWKGHLFGSGSDSRETSRNFSHHCCPYGKPGDRLWVRETWTRAGNGDPGYLTYRATYPDCLPPDLENIPPASELRWKPSIHMFRRDSRILLEITDVRVERLQDISEKQALAEGIVGVAFRPDDGWPICTGYMVGPDDGKTGLQTTAAKAFAGLWDSVGGDWNANPWVWVVEFKQVTP